MRTMHFCIERFFLNYVIIQIIQQSIAVNGKYLYAQLMFTLWIKIAMSLVGTKLTPDLGKPLTPPPPPPHSRILQKSKTRTPIPPKPEFCEKGKVTRKADVILILNTYLMDRVREGFPDLKCLLPL